MAGNPSLGSIFRAVLRCAVAAVLVYAGAMKALDPATFAVALQGYQLVPEPLAALMALYVPWLEIVCGAGLLLAPWRSGAWSLSLLLSLGFVVFLGSAWARGLDVSCGCFGDTAPQPVGPLAVGRAVVLALAAAIGLTYDRASPAGSRLTDPAAGPA